MNIEQASVGDRVRFKSERMPYTVQARSDRYLVCTKPFNLQRTVLYTIVDLVERVRGPENLVFGMGAETRESCEQMIDRLEGRDGDVCGRTEVSGRNRVALDVVSVSPSPGGGRRVK